MKKTNYKALKETQLRNELSKHVTPQCQGLFSKKEIQSFVAELPLKSLLNRSYEVILTDSAKTIAQHLTLTNSRDEHSWAGQSGFVQEGKILYGDAVLGENYHYQYSDNGNITEDTDEQSLPNFELGQKLCVLITSHDWSNNGENHCSHDLEYDKYSYALVIYLPAKENKKIS